jgi:Flp pilus assembly protein TadB
VNRGIRTPLPIKGKILWQKDEAQIVGRIPVFPLIFIIEWLIGTVLIGVSLALTQSLWYIAMLAAMFAFGCGFYFFSVHVERARAKAIIEEFRKTVQRLHHTRNPLRGFRADEARRSKPPIGTA